MKIKLRSKVRSVQRRADETVIHLDFTGKVMDTKLLNARESSMFAELTLKTLMADNLKVGSTFTILLDDEASDDRID